MTDGHVVALRIPPHPIGAGGSSGYGTLLITKDNDRCNWNDQANFPNQYWGADPMPMMKRKFRGM
jgi:hypothetical protein